MPRISYANVTATLALVVALSGSAYAATKVRSKDIVNGQVKAVDLGKNAVTSAKVRDRSLLAKDFKAGQLPRGVQGPAGVAGAPGAPGGAGPAGAPGLSEYEVVKVTDDPGNAAQSRSAAASCPAGKKVLGGGAQILGGESLAYLFQSYTNSANNSYYAQTETVGGAVNHGITVFATCAKVG